MATLTIDGIEWTTLGRERWAPAQFERQPFSTAYIEALVDTSSRSVESLDATNATVRLTTPNYTVEGCGMFRSGSLVSNGYEAFVCFEGENVQQV